MLIVCHSNARFLFSIYLFYFYFFVVDFLLLLFFTLLHPRNNSVLMKNIKKSFTGNKTVYGFGREVPSHCHTEAFLSLKTELELLILFK